MKTIDTLLIGRKTFEVMLASGQTSYPGAKNYVFTRSKKRVAQLTKVLGARKRPDKTVQIISEDAAAFVQKLKLQQKGKGIVVFGGGELAKTLVAADLIDEIVLNIQPVLNRSRRLCARCNCRGWLAKPRVTLRIVLRHTLSVFRSFNQSGQTLESGFFLLRTDNEPVHHLAIPWRLGREEFPRCFVLFESAQIRFDQFGTSLFVGINAGTIFFAEFVGFQPGGLHPFIFDQSFDVAVVHRTPDAAWFSGCETDLVALFVNRLANAVNPSETERFID